MPLIFDVNGSYVAHECPECGVIRFASVVTPPGGWEPIDIEGTTDHLCPNCQRILREKCHA